MARIITITTKMPAAAASFVFIVYISAGIFYFPAGEIASEILSSARRLAMARLSEGSPGFEAEARQFERPEAEPNKK